MRINLTTPMSDDKERQRRNEVIIAAIERHTEERMDDAYGRIHTDGSRSGGQPVLKPCPFCDGEAAIVEFQAAGGPWYMGECQEPSCDAAGPAFTTEAEAIAVYNTRQPTQAAVVHKMGWCFPCNTNECEHIQNANAELRAALEQSK